MSLLVFSLLFVTGIAGGFVGGIAGGGGSMITLSTLLFLGIPPQIAIGTDRLGNFGYVVSTGYKFLKSKKIVFKYALPFIFLSITGSVIGANILLKVDSGILSFVIGAILLILLPVILIKKNIGIKSGKIESKKTLILGFLLFFAISIYDGFIGLAGGILIAYLFIFIFKFTYIEANATDKVPYFFNSIISLVVFAYHGIINYSFAVPILLGTLAGGYLGAHVAIKNGEKFVKLFFVIFVIATSVKLFFF